MNKVICMKGHFYDGDKYEECPHCAAGVEAVRQDPFSVRHSELEAEEKSGKKKGGLFHRGEKKEAAFKQAAKSTESSARGTVLLQENMEAGVPRQKSEQKFEPIPEQKADAAVSWQKAQAALAGREAQAAAAGQEALEQNSIKQNSIEQKSIEQGAMGREALKSQESVSKSLRAAFAASARNDEKGDEGKTVGYFSTGKTEPPVGYLICTAGEDYGMGFPLKTGNNSIGRSASMDVVILDEKVSREKQAFVLYEPLKREFYMKPGEGTGLCYLNGELVLGPIKMKAFDIIMLGDTKLMLIPVCCEKFSWGEGEL